jgi:hypothetical protein
VNTLLFTYFIFAKFPGRLTEIFVGEYVTKEFVWMKIAGVPDDGRLGSINLLGNRVWLRLFAG